MVHYTTIMLSTRLLLRGSQPKKSSTPSPEIISNCYEAKLLKIHHRVTWNQSRNQENLIRPCGIVCVVIFIYLIVSCARRSFPVYSIVYNAVVLTDIYIMILVLTTCQCVHVHASSAELRQYIWRRGEIQLTHHGCSTVGQNAGVQSLIRSRFLHTWNGYKCSSRRTIGQISFWAEKTHDSWTL